MCPMWFFFITKVFCQGASMCLCGFYISLHTVRPAVGGLGTMLISFTGVVGSNQFLCALAYQGCGSYCTTLQKFG